MVKASTIFAAFSLIMLICMASLVYAEDAGEQDATPRATVNLSQIKSSASKTDRRLIASEKVSEKSAADDSPSSSEPADAEMIAGLSADRGGSSTVSADGDDDVAAAAAPVFLGSADDTCMGSSGGGVQGNSFGFSLGSTWTDENCKMLKNARELKSHGHHAAAQARLCMDNDNALAFELAGEPCPRALPSAQAAIRTIRQHNPSYQAATGQRFQVAALSDGTGRNNQPAAESQNLKKISGLASIDEEAGAVPAIGTLIAMVVSAVNQVASSVSFDLDNDLNGASAMDGIE